MSYAPVRTRRRDVSPAIALAQAIDPEVVTAARLAEQLRRASSRLVPAQAGAAAVLCRLEGWKHLCFPSLRVLALECLGRSARWLFDLARLWRVLQRLPAVEAAVTGADGGRALGRVAACEIGKVATPDTVATWIARARRLTIRALKDLVRRELAEPTAFEPDPRERVATTVTVEVPAFLATSYEDAVEVYCANNPGAPRRTFLEALLAECQSGVAAPRAGLDADEQPTKSPHARSRRVRNEERLSPVPDGAPVATVRSSYATEIVLAQVALHKVEAHVAQRLGSGDEDGTQAAATPRSTQAAERALQSLQDAAALERLIARRLDQLLLWLDDRRAWSLLGFPDAAAFGRHVLDESPSTTAARLRRARALEQSTVLREANDTGRIPAQHILRLVRLRRERSLDEEHVQDWIDHVTGRSLKRLDDELRLLAREPHRDPRPLTDKEWFDSIRLTPGASRARLLQAGLEALATETPTRRTCANVFLRLHTTAGMARDLRHSLNRARLALGDRAQALAHLSPADEARVVPSIRLARQRLYRGHRLPDWLCLMAMLEEFLEQHDNPRGMPRRRFEAVLCRDGWRCTAPFCTARAVEVHHVRYRSQRGGDEPGNLTSLCPFHHRMGEHGDLTAVTGKAPLDLVWRFGSGANARWYRNEKRLEGPPAQRGA